MHDYAEEPLVHARAPGVNRSTSPATTVTREVHGGNIGHALRLVGLLDVVLHIRGTDLLFDRTATQLRQQRIIPACRDTGLIVIDPADPKKNTHTRYLLEIALNRRAGPDTDLFEQATAMPDFGGLYFCRKDDQSLRMARPHSYRLFSIFMQLARLRWLDGGRPLLLCLGMPNLERDQIEHAERITADLRIAAIRAHTINLRALIEFEARGDVIAAAKMLRQAYATEVSKALAGVEQDGNHQESENEQVFQEKDRGYRKTSGATSRGDIVSSLCSSSG